jgi:hypothetical protein
MSKINQQTILGIFMEWVTVLVIHLIRKLFLPEFEAWHQTGKDSIAQQIAAS